MIQSKPSTVPWLRRDQWDLFCESYVNPTDLHSSYDEWLQDTASGIDAFRRAGLPVRRVDIDVREWVAWCKDERRKRDAQALLLFTMTKASVS